jgi:hypothetical protein
MEIQHKILSFDPRNGGLVVQYYTADNSDGLVFNIDLPVENGEYPSQEEVQGVIELHTPRGQLERISAIKNASVSNFLLAHVPSNLAQQDAAQIKAIKVRAIRNELLQVSDYTQLPDTPLSQVQREAWAEYRQALRDITAQDGFPMTVIFPLSPDSEPR